MNPVPWRWCIQASQAIVSQAANDGQALSKQRAAIRDGKKIYSLVPSGGHLCVRPRLLPGARGERIHAEIGDSSDGNNCLFALTSVVSTVFVVSSVACSVTVLGLLAFLVSNFTGCPPTRPTRAPSRNAGGGVSGTAGIMLLGIWKHALQAATYLSAPPITSTSVPSTIRFEKGALMCDTVQAAVWTATASQP